MSLLPSILGETEATQGREVNPQPCLLQQNVPYFENKGLIYSLLLPKMPQKKP